MSEINDLIEGIKTAEELISRRQMALRLSENPDFKELFLKGFFMEEAARLVQLSGDPSLTLEQRADALEMAKATGHAKRFLSMTAQMGAHAERELPQMEETLAELRSMDQDE